MAEYLVIRLPAESDHPAGWVAVDTHGTRIGAPGAGSLEQAAAAARGRPVIVLVPAASVLTTRVDIPVRSGARLLAALPFALEEHVADDVETLHFAPGQRGDSGRLPVAVVAHEAMREWLDRLGGAGIVPERMVPETFGLARVPGTLSLLVAEGRILFNDGGDDEFVLEGVKPSDALAVAGVLDGPGADADADADDGKAPRHLQVYCEPADEAHFRYDWIALRHELDEVDIHLLPDGVLPRLAVTVAAGHGIDLLQGRYGAKSEVGALIRPWKLAAALLVALGVLGLVGKAVDTWRLSGEAESLSAQFTEVCQQIRPGACQNAADPLQVAESILRSFGGTAAQAVFLPAVQELAMAMQQNSTAEIEALSYRAGIIDVRLTAPDVDTLDSIRQAVSRSGRFAASIQSTDQVGDRQNSRIQIREAGQ